jgi:hypothetical protein
MNPTLQITSSALMFVFLLCSPAAAQLVNIRTAPVSVSEQFYTFPSQLLGMGGSIALKDLEADPFSNPATGARIKGTIITSTPTLYSMPGDNGFGRTLPVALLTGTATSFGAVSFAPQELESAEPTNFFPFWMCAANGCPPTITPHRDRFAHNFYSFGMLGQTFPKSRSSIAMSLSYANLDALHAVDLLYPSALSLEQDGHMSDFRLGYLRELDGDRSIEAVLVRNHVDMEHTVTYQNWRWTQTGVIVDDPRVEYNSDKTTTYGAHVGYRHPMPASKWHLAGFVTGNSKTHPKIPNYQFMSIPRDPGNSWAFALGLGAARVDSASLWSFDFTYEPVWTTTWAEAASPMKSASGKTIPTGAPTIENEMVFSNYNMHVGWLHRWDELGLQLGMNVRHISYWLDQYNNVTEQFRQQDEGWSEVTLNWGLTLKFAALELRYFGHNKSGGFEIGARQDMVVTAPGADIDIVAAPSAPLSMDVNRVIIHQFGVSVPVGRKR